MASSKRIRKARLTVFNFELPPSFPECREQVQFHPRLRREILFQHRILLLESCHRRPQHLCLLALVAASQFVLVLSELQKIVENIFLNHDMTDNSPHARTSDSASPGSVWFPPSSSALASTCCSHSPAASSSFYRSRSSALCSPCHRPVCATSSPGSVVTRNTGGFFALAIEVQRF